MKNACFAAASMALVTVAAAQTPAPSADLAAGKARVELGVRGVPRCQRHQHRRQHPQSIAGQRVAYIEAQLRALKAGTRKAAQMNAIAAQLSPADISNVAAYFNSLSPANMAGKSEQLPNLVRTQVAFPRGLQVHVQDVHRR